MEESVIACGHTVEHSGPESRPKVLREAREETDDYGVISRVTRHVKLEEHHRK